MRTDAPITEEAVNATPRASLAASITATAAVAIAPAFIAFSFFVFRRTDPHFLVAILVAIPLTIIAVMAVSRAWAAQPGSAGVPLGDLMLWSRIRRRNARRTIDAALNVLGSDRSGAPTGTGVDDPGVRVRAMRAIAEALDAMSSYTLGHSRRVERHARKLARALDLDETETESVALAATLHDVGNVTIPDHLLHKAGPLSAEERAVVESHVVAGRELIARSVPADVAQAILHHHECWDGSGYPDSLSGLEIPLFARMIAVAEAYDAMTSTRPYRQGLGRAGAIDALTAASGTQFDPDIVDAFITTLRRPFFEPSSPLLAAFATQIRETVLGLRRIGAVALSATASTIVLALVVGSTAITPPVSERPVVAAADRGSQRDLVLGDRVTNDPTSAPSGDSDQATGGDTTDVAPPADTDPLAGSISVFTAQVDAGSIDSGTTGGSDPGAGGGGTGPGSGTGGGGQDPGVEPTPTPDPGTTPGDPGTPTDGGTGEQPPPSDGGTGDTKDKNPDANGNGHAYGHDKSADGSELPGVTTDAPGNSENAPGHNKG